MTESLEQFARMLASARRAVFFGGAGVSTESGIPDFRSTDGLYRQKWRYPPETILSFTFFHHNTEEFYRFYREKMLFPDAAPNPAHLALAKWEREGRISAIVTQNIDGLHQAAGSRRVIELHGSVLRNHCTECGKFYGLEAILHTKGVPHCDCGGLIKPDVVLYEEQLPEQAIEDALEVLGQADLLIIGGTSLSVYPAAAFAAFYRGPLVIVNRSETQMDEDADLVIRQPIGETFAKVDAIMAAKG